jgi:hypothetical protein
MAVYWQKAGVTSCIQRCKRNSNIKFEFECDFSLAEAFNTIITMPLWLVY